MENPGFRQTTSTVLMVRPVNFGFNPQTADSNAFQTASTRHDPSTIQQMALQEFNAFSEKLRQSGVEVVIFDDTPSPHTPDSIFPNNWVSFHQDGRVVLYPMQAHNRRLERKEHILQDLKDKYGFVINEVLDLTYFEDQNRFLEGTGSMILDRVNRLAYACRSSRTSEYVLDVFCREFNYEPVLFTAADNNGMPVYHTNVVMEVGENIAILCTEAMTDDKEKSRLKGMIRDSGKHLIEISLLQMQMFAGNMLQLRNRQGELLLVMSEQGYKSLHEDQLQEIQGLTKVIYSDISHIEKFGGGSARCMLAEIFLPPA